MNFRPVLFVSGVLLLVLSVAMFPPMIVDLAARDPGWKVFAGSQISTTFAAFLLIFSNREKAFRLSVREVFLATVTGWMLAAAFGALPFCLSNLNMKPAEGFFEAMSGLTTTGFTVIAGLEQQSRGILLWRALLHWLGGIGGLVAALSVLPFLQVSGQRVFRAQAPDIAKIMPSSSQMAAWICLLYTGMTALCALLLSQAGMGAFDALCHALSAVSTGGFSTADRSVGHFDAPLAEIVLMVFMLAGALPFTLYLRMMRGDGRAVLRDGQARAFLGAVALLFGMMTVYLLFSSPLPLWEALRHAAFRVVALMTTSGFTLGDEALWGPFAVAAFFVMAFVGGCSGSTAGGIRVFRFQIFLSMLRLQVNKLIEPNGVFQAHYAGKPVDVESQQALSVFLLVYVFCFMAAGALLALTGLNFAPAFTSAFAAMANIGPSLDTLSSPLPDFTVLRSTPLWILSACMLLGRLEIFTVLVLFAPRFWRR